MNRFLANAKEHLVKIEKEIEQILAKPEMFGPLDVGPDGWDNPKDPEEEHFYQLLETRNKLRTFIEMQETR